jgi:hypothetical protein
LRQRGRSQNNRAGIVRDYSRDYDHNDDDNHNNDLNRTAAQTLSWNRPCSRGLPERQFPSSLQFLK